MQSNCDWCPYNRRVRAQTHTHTHRKDHLRTQQEGNHLQTSKRDLRESNLADILILDFQPPEL